MSEWEEKLNTLLSDPDAMAQVMNIAQNLSQQMGQSGGSAPPPRGRCGRSCAVCSHAATAAGRSDGRSFVAARRH